MNQDFIIFSNLYALAINLHSFFNHIKNKDWKLENFLHCVFILSLLSHLPSFPCTYRISANGYHNTYSFLEA